MKKILFMACLTAMVFVGASCTGKEGASSAKPLPADCFSYTLTDDGKGIKIYDFSDKAYEEDSKGYLRCRFSVLNIPSEIEGLPVKCIFTYSRLSSKFDSVIIPDGVTVLSEPGRDDMPTISTKKLILGKNVQFPDSYRFEHLEEFFVPESVTELGWYYEGTFTTAVIPEHIKEIPKNRGFSYCDNLKEITFPDGIKIDKGADFSIGTLSVKTQQRLRELRNK
ncbi:leucine-rich repeat protein [Treponema pedis]|uniref:Lipoprotein n=1 Tax=Treponema pedis str. T A4 TaxID=1291379 RepID=S6A2J5_9SPIR|nr:leucine-rich repeat protein [Treponema pedis]AGT42726.1 hypothetical protein TPE_0230 [Treponema pedis str. T A4]